MRYLLAADTGGTFTDIVVFDQRTKATQFGKTLTNYQDLVAGVLDGLSDTDGQLDEVAVFKHGTTHVINAFVQRKGARTALVTTEGFRDLLEIGRGLDPQRLPQSRERAAGQADPRRRIGGHLRDHGRWAQPGVVGIRTHLDGGGQRVRGAPGFRVHGSTGGCVRSRFPARST